MYEFKFGVYNPTVREDERELNKAAASGGWDIAFALPYGDDIAVIFKRRILRDLPQSGTGFLAEELPADLLPPGTRRSRRAGQRRMTLTP